MSSVPTTSASKRSGPTSPFHHLEDSGPAVDTAGSQRGSYGSIVSIDDQVRPQRTSAQHPMTPRSNHEHLAHDHPVPA